MKTSRKTETSDRFVEERRRQILDLALRRGRVAVPDLVRQFGVTPVTVRKDLRFLDGAGQLVRTHGGAVPRESAGHEPTSAEKKIVNRDRKRRLAEAALSLIAPGDRIVLDTGTTTMELARLLKSIRDLTVVTNDIEIARVLEPCEHIQVCLLGGILRRGFHCTLTANDFAPVPALRVDKAFMAANAFSVEHGGTTPDLRQAETKRLLIGMARQTILLCDSSKLGKSSFACFGPIKTFDMLVTDPGIKASDAAAFRAAGMKILVSPPGSDLETRIWHLQTFRDAGVKV
jgi:DeoR family fructose operon transcriptional repressor